MGLDESKTETLAKTTKAKMLQETEQSTSRIPSATTKNREHEKYAQVECNLQEGRKYEYKISLVLLTMLLR